MSDPPELHFVESWLRRNAEELSPEDLLRLGDAALAALWKRARITLGDVTLLAITDRVLLNAAANFAPFKNLKVDRTGIDLGGVRRQCRGYNSQSVFDAVRFILTEFIRVIGRLTADILTPAFEAELLAIGRGNSGNNEGTDHEQIHPG